MISDMNVDILWAKPFKIKVKFTLLSVLACCGDCDWMPGLFSWLTGQQPIVICNVLSVSMYVNCGNHCPPEPSLEGGIPHSALLPKPVKRFETVMVIKGYTN